MKKELFPLRIFEGSGVALVTPMKADGAVDYKKLEELVEWQISEGTDAIIACGTTGEASTLANDEHIAVIETVVKKGERTNSSYCRNWCKRYPACHRIIDWC